MLEQPRNILNNKTIMDNEEISDEEDSEFNIWPEPYNINRKNNYMSIFSEYYDSVEPEYLGTLMQSQRDNNKNSDVSEYYRKMGNRSFREGNYTQALYYFNGCLMYARVEEKNQDMNYGLALEHRSQVFYCLEKYVECLSDINLIPSTKCPEYLYFKIFVRKCCCYFNLKDYKLAWEALLEAKSYFKQTYVKYINDKLSDAEKLCELEEKLKRHLRKSTNDTKNENLPRINKYIDQTKSVKLITNNSGKHMTATKIIEERSVLFVETPYAVSCVIPINHLTFICQNCLKIIAAFIPCTGCVEMYYCSIECRAIFWADRHKWECLGFRKSLLTPSMSLALGILFRSSFRELEFDSSISSLSTNIENMSNEDIILYLQMSCSLVIYLKYFTDFFESFKEYTTTNFRKTGTLRRYVGGLLLKYLLQIQSNGEYIGDCFPGSSFTFNQGLDFRGKALALYTKSRMITHSCDPNCVVKYGGGITKVLISVRKIKPGERITVNYIKKKLCLNFYDLKFNPKKRHNYLKKHFINCTCSFCNVDFLLQRNNFWKCKNCSERLVHQKNQLKCDYCGAEFNLTVYKKLQKIIKDKYNEIEENGAVAAKDLNHLEELMKDICHTLNFNFIYLYGLCAYYYEKLGDYVKTFGYVKKVALLLLYWFKPSDIIVASSWVYLVTICIKNHFSLIPYTVQSENSLLEDIQEIVKFTTSLLNYHMSYDNIAAFKKIVTTLLNSTHPSIRPSQVTNIIYYHCSKTPVLLDSSASLIKNIFMHC